MPLAKILISKMPHRSSQVQVHSRYSRCPFNHACSPAALWFANCTQTFLWFFQSCFWQSLPQYSTVLHLEHFLTLSPFPQTSHPPDSLLGSSIPSIVSCINRPVADLHCGRPQIGCRRTLMNGSSFLCKYEHGVNIEVIARPPQLVLLLPAFASHSAWYLGTMAPIFLRNSSMYAGVLCTWAGAQRLAGTTYLCFHSGTLLLSTGMKRTVISRVAMME
jgi:hypothetical protein